ncbi:Lysophosphatidic acid:oleoyl-CoA acyltransferase 1 [Exophiala dermatitidis]|nr:Lysophosphatidic acid:oleoyl-CoA acyltransferase 1 [Exophiala dermatitidis]KAJ4524395.1 Lysophosphatidic acid:oleoyl-CoA acyltransferase 1 [Exophiala dermatitidis]KAJ4525334.1 Lysophosphatidic acid:oleoyl-CoA acyltransferase 1 [Exophiala dermatitidis]KAJ4536646.1 Lysophosphatidic acid:oleoyl-CoA acyltransferase 1 [Exophiala dermatitidis]KAJ4555753.1 Lysophosphatidic acid:oleoyl-CoA acyltransferase 1 [Exophiala dermatitidis]
MEKFSQFRDKGSGIAPFLPIPTEPAGIRLPFHIFLFVCRVPLLLLFSISYFLVLQWMPIGVLGRKASLWCILGIPGIWWVDLQIDGVKKGSLAKNSASIPRAGSVIASSSTSPIDSLYLSAIFDPIFAASYPNTRLVEPISLFTAVCRAFSYPKLNPSIRAKLVDLETYIKQNPNRIVVVFPECTTSNGRGILPMSPSLLTVPPRTKVFPVSLRYTPNDISTPVPHAYFTFLWNLCSKPSHCIRIRIAEAIYNTSRRNMEQAAAKSSAYSNSHLDTSATDSAASDADTLVGSEELEGPATREEKMFLDKIAEALARLGRVKRVGLGVKEKIDFLEMWNKSRRRR